MRKFFTLYIPLIISVALVAVKLPEVDNWFRGQLGENGTVYIALTLVGLTILNHTITIISPFKKYEKLEKNKLLLLDHVTESFLGDKLFGGYNIVANVRLPRNRFFSNLEPCRAKSAKGKLFHLLTCFSKKLLVTIWVSKGNTIPKKLKMTTTQGVSGMAYSEGKVAIVDIPENINNLNFNEKQKRVISGNGFVISYPVFAFDEKYSRLSTKIIGVVTLSCNKKGSERLIKSQQSKEVLIEKIVGFSKLCSLIL